MDGDGFISLEELCNSIERLGLEMTDDKVEQLIRAADLNEDGKISYQGFYQATRPEVWLIMFTEL